MKLNALKYTVAQKIETVAEQAKRIACFAPNIVANKFNIQHRTWKFSSKREAVRFATKSGGFLVA